MKTLQVVKAYQLLKNAKLTKVDYSDKFKAIKALIAMRPIVEKYEADKKEGIEKLKDEKFEEMQQKASKHNEAIQNKTKEWLLSLDELKELNEYFENYQKAVNDFINPLDDAEAKPEFEKLSETVFGKLVDSNDFTCEEIMSLYDAIV